MQIPKSFNLHGFEIEVVKSPNLLERDDVFGWAKYRDNRVEF